MSASRKIQSSHSRERRISSSFIGVIGFGGVATPAGRSSPARPDWFWYE
jgi:hypothetical protein